MKTNILEINDEKQNFIKKSSLQLDELVASSLFSFFRRTINLIGLSSSKLSSAGIHLKRAYVDS